MRSTGEVGSTRINLQTAGERGENKHVFGELVLYPELLCSVDPDVITMKSDTSDVMPLHFKHFSSVLFAGVDGANSPLPLVLSAQERRTD